MPELEPVKAGLGGQLVEQRLVHDRRLRHAEAAERPRHRAVRVDRPRERAHVRHEIRSGRVDRDAVRDGVAPRGVSAGVEVAREVGGHELPLAVAGEPRAHPGRVALRGRGHGLGPRVHRPHRPAELPRRDRQQRLHRDVELAAERATDRGGHDLHPLGLDPEDARGLVAVHVRRLGAGEDPDAVANPLGVARLGLDVRVLDEARRELALGHVRRSAERRLDVALRDPAADQDVVRIWRVNRLLRIGQCLLDLGLRRLRRPADRDLVVADAEHGMLLADQAQHRLAVKPHAAVGEHRLILHVGKDAEAVDRDIARRDHVDQAWMRGTQRGEIADREPRLRVRRADSPQPQRARRGAVGRIDLGSDDLRHPVDLERAKPHRCAGWCIREHRVARRAGQHRLDDLAIAGAAAEHAAERIERLRFARPGVACEEARARHQHAGRADPALRRPVREERALEPVEVAACGKAFDSRHRAALDLPQRNEAGADLPSVEQHGAGATIAGIAADLRAGEPEFVA